MPLLDVADSLLLVIDAQDGFYPATRADVDLQALRAAIDRMAWVASLATALEVPVVVTEEDAETNGRTEGGIRNAVGGRDAHVKAVFGAAGNPEILAAVMESGRGTIVLIGMETDVCVAHSAVGLRDVGLRVVVIRDAVFSAGRAHLFGLARLSESGIELMSAKELYYDWLRNLAAVRAFDSAHPDLSNPPGFSL